MRKGSASTILIIFIRCEALVPMLFMYSVSCPPLLVDSCMSCPAIQSLEFFNYFMQSKLSAKIFMRWEEQENWGDGEKRRCLGGERRGRCGEGEGEKEENVLEVRVGRRNEQCKKKVIIFPVPILDVAHQTLPGRELLNYSRPGRDWLVTSRLGTGKTINFFYSVG